MPCVDMSLDRLKEYGGRNPKPVDFDEFWDAALAEMRSIDPKAEFKSYPFPYFIPKRVFFQEFS